jgi:hypothetical protein
MMESLKLLGVLLLAVVSVTGGCKKKVASVPPSDPRIVGFWTSQGGDYPLTNEYRADGTVVQHVFGKTTKPRPFRIEGNVLIYSVEQPDGKILEPKETFQLTEDTLTFIDSQTSKRVFQRDKSR